MAMSKENARSQKYQDKAIRRVVVKANRFTEPDILEHIERQDNIQGYIKDLIRKDIANRK